MDNFASCGRGSGRRDCFGNKDEDSLAVVEAQVVETALLMVMVMNLIMDMVKKTTLIMMNLKKVTLAAVEETLTKIAEKASMVLQLKLIAIMEYQVHQIILVHSMVDLAHHHSILTNKYINTS